MLNFSQSWALYCLVQFYSVTKHKLAPIKPLAKFLTFKSIVFLTWWQGLAVAFLFSLGALKGHLAQVLKARIQDYIICIEVSILILIYVKCISCFIYFLKKIYRFKIPLLDTEFELYKSTHSSLYERMLENLKPDLAKLYTLKLECRS